MKITEQSPQWKVNEGGACWTAYEENWAPVFILLLLSSSKHSKPKCAPWSFTSYVTGKT